MTTIIAIRTVWLNVAADPTDAQSFPYMSALKSTPAQDGEVRKLASGGLRAVRRGKVSTVWEASLPGCDRGQIDWLEARIGQVVCARDDRGRRIFGIYWSVPTDEHQYDDRGDVTLAVEETDWVEEI